MATKRGENGAASISHTFVIRALSLILFFILLALEGCAPRSRLRPDPDARLAEDGRGAVAEAFGIRIVARGDAWRGRPATLEDVLTPLHVTIENQSGRPIQIRYNHFVMVGLRGFRSFALPPFEIEGTAEVPVPPRSIAPGFLHQGFFVAPHHHPFFGAHMSPWRRPFGFDPTFYQNHYILWPVRLPTQDMIQQAIPEGVLDDTGQISGFLYFQRIGPEVSRVTLTVEWADADTAERIGTTSIPFVIG